MGLFGKKGTGTKCKECGLEMRTAERLRRHCNKAHGNVPEKKMNPEEAGGGTW